MNLLALDPSLTCTGWAAKADGYNIARGTFSPDTFGVERLASMVKWLDLTLHIWQPHLVILESYSFASRHQAHQLGELGGVLRLTLYEREVPFIALAPMVRAKLATGKGNASKEHVLAEAVRRLGYTGHSFDEADALWLLQAGLIFYGLPGAVEIPKSQRAVLAGLEWPAVVMQETTAA